MPWLEGLSSTRGVSRVVMSSFEGAAEASIRSRSSSSGRMAEQGSRRAIWSSEVSTASSATCAASKRW
jgi:hypothetical protein